MPTPDSTTDFIGLWGHYTDNYSRLKLDIPDLIDLGKITDLKIRKPNTHNNPLPNYRNTPPPDAPILMIGTRLREEQVSNSFVNVDLGSPKVELEEPTQTERLLEHSIHVLEPVERSGGHSNVHTQFLNLFSDDGFWEPLWNPVAA